MTWTTSEEARCRAFLLLRSIDRAGQDKTGYGDSTVGDTDRIQSRRIPLALYRYHMLVDSEDTLTFMYDVPHLKAQLMLYISELLMKDNQPGGDAGLAMMQAVDLLL